MKLGEERRSKKCNDERMRALMDTVSINRRLTLK